MFTTRPDTLMGVTFCRIAAEHPLAQRAAAANPRRWPRSSQDCKQGGVSEAELETQEKRGMDTGLRALHPITGEALPVWVANFVLMGYGTGAVMAVPGHDQRDWEFAQQYALPIRMVIVPAKCATRSRRSASTSPRTTTRCAARSARRFDRCLRHRAAVQVVEEFERTHRRRAAPTPSVAGW